ncbi:MAG: hypothetical protein LBC35_07415 [Coriobacteriales bacterium]|jgi:uncharacterized protein YycO|nr:hypothetical protein [Coriobacteriales bacterium]
MALTLCFLFAPTAVLATSSTAQTPDATSYGDATQDNTEPEESQATDSSTLQLFPEFTEGSELDQDETAYSDAIKDETLYADTLSKIENSRVRDFLESSLASLNRDLTLREAKAIKAIDEAISIQKKAMLEGRSMVDGLTTEEEDALRLVYELVFGDTETRDNHSNTAPAKEPELDYSHSVTSNNEATVNTLSLQGTVQSGSAKGDAIGVYPVNKGTILVTDDPYLGSLPVGHAAIIYTGEKAVTSLPQGVDFEDNDWYNRHDTIFGLDVKATTTVQEEAVADWCFGQIGKPYNFNLLDVNTRSSFYCSQLVYAGFLDCYGVDLNTPEYTLLGANAIHPMEFVDGDKTSLVYRCGQSRADRWVNVNGSWYYVDANGAPLTYWQQLSSGQYYFGPDGVMRTYWHYLGNDWYYFYPGSDGRMATNHVQADSGGNCYLKSDGRAARSEWIYIAPWGQYRNVDAYYHII